MPGPGTSSPPQPADGPFDQSGQTPELFDRVYSQLRGLAHNQMSRERAGCTLQTTALVHEVYLRLMKEPEFTWANPRQFFGAAAEAMRRILIERARRYAYPKHGGGRKRFDFIDTEAVGGTSIALEDHAESAAAMLDLDEALTKLKAQDAQLWELVMLRFFAGLSVEETAAASGRSPRSVKRDWSFARAWLSRCLEHEA